MFTMEEVLSDKNQKAAFEHFSGKKDGCGLDGMHLSELEEYWKINKERICEELKNREYQPGVILIYEHINKTGKRRNIANLNVLDRFITRLLAQKMNQYITPLFCHDSYAYQDGKGVITAVTKAKEYAEHGMRYVAEIDLKSYFDMIPLNELILEIKKYISDEAILHLVKQYLFCNILFEGKITRKTKGIIQGNSISPILSNLYLHGFDQKMEQQNLCWIRYADNIYVYTDSYEKAVYGFNELTRDLEERKLTVNQKKSGVFELDGRTVLGYDILLRNGKADVRRHVYKSINQYSRWYSSKMQFINGRYHIVSDGIINRQDFTLLFENEQKKHFIPVEVTDQINFYGNVTLTSGVLQTFSSFGIKASFFDRYGHLVGTFLPENQKAWPR